MLYGFDTDDEHAAVAALLIYAVWRSRDHARFKVTPDLWGQVERFAKAAAKRAETLPQFIEALKPRLMCATIRPQWIEVGARGEMPMVAVHDPETGALRHVIQFGDRDLREFGTRVIERADRRQVLDRLYRETAWCVLLVRDRLERERPIVQKFDLETDPQESAA